MMKTMSETDIKTNLRNVLSLMEIACNKRPEALRYKSPTLVAVSKTKPASSIIECYEAGQSHFGENYVQELVEKANNAEVLEKCKEIQWHFIGNIQSNKISKILSIPNLHAVESVDRIKIAEALNKNWPKFSTGQKLNVFIQVNTSNEEAKGGTGPDGVIDLAKYVLNDCANLKLLGLMTIGKYGYSVEKDGPNPDFICLKKCRDDLSQELNIDGKDIELSMGMTADYEHAIEVGSTNVRVGTAIFGERDISKMNRE